MGVARSSISFFPRRRPPVARQNSYATLRPLHPQVVEAILPVLDGRRDDELVFEQLSFQLWLRHTDVQLRYGDARVVNGDLRKFCEQHGDIIQWDQSNRAYVMTHGVIGIDWKHYKHPLPEHVYDVYMKYWADVNAEEISSNSDFLLLARPAQRPPQNV